MFIFLLEDNFSMLFDQKLFETYQRFFDIDDNFMFKLDDDEEHEVRLVEERGVTNSIYERTIERIIYLMQEKYAQGNYIIKNFYKNYFSFENKEIPYYVQVLSFQIYPDEITEKEVVNALYVDVTLNEITCDEYGEYAITDFLVKNGGKCHCELNKDIELINRNLLDYAIIRCSGFVVNGKFLSSVLREDLSHEFHHLFEYLQRLIRKVKKNKGISRQSVKLVDNQGIYRQIQEILRENNSDVHKICFARLLYYLYYNAEMNAYVNSIFSNLKNKESTRATFRRDIQSSQAYIIYKFLKENAMPLGLSDGEHWNYFAKLFGYDDNVGGFKKKMTLLFKKRMKIFFHKIMRAASYYYDTIDDLKNKNE